MTTDGRRTNTRQSLVRAATGLFRRHGLGATSVADVCHRSGVTKGVFSHHFPGGRRELDREVIRQNGVDVAQQLRAVAADEADAVALIASVFDGYADLMTAKGPDFGCPVAAGVVEADTATAGDVRTAFRSWRAELASSLPDDDLATLVVAGLEGAILLARAEGDPDVVRRIGHTLGSLVADATNPRRGTRPARRPTRR